MPFFNDTPKHVVSTTLRDADAWQNSAVMGGYDVDAIRELTAGGDVYVSGSGTLVRALLADGLLDELHLFVYPLVLGGGARLFPDGGQPLPLALLDQQAYSNGVLHLAYGPS